MGTKFPDSNLTYNLFNLPLEIFKLKTNKNYTYKYNFESYKIYKHVFLSTLNIKQKNV